MRIHYGLTRPGRAAWILLASTLLLALPAHSGEAEADHIVDIANLAIATERYARGGSALGAVEISGKVLNRSGMTLADVSVEAHIGGGARTAKAGPAFLGSIKPGESGTFLLTAAGVRSADGWTLTVGFVKDGSRGQESFTGGGPEAPKTAASAVPAARENRLPADLLTDGLRAGTPISFEALRGDFPNPAGGLTLAGRLKNIGEEKLADVTLDVEFVLEGGASRSLSVPLVTGTLHPGEARDFSTAVPKADWYPKAREALIAYGYLPVIEEAAADGAGEEDAGPAFIPSFSYTGTRGRGVNVWIASLEMLAVGDRGTYVVAGAIRNVAPEPIRITGVVLDLTDAEGARVLSHREPLETFVPARSYVRFSFTVMPDRPFVSFAVRPEGIGEKDAP